MDYTSIFLFEDIVNYLVSNYFCFVDTLALRIAYPPVNKFIHDEYKNVNVLMSKRLSQVFGDSCEEFMKNLAKHGKYISGSFLLQVVYGEVWQGSDIDIYYLTNSSYVKTFEDKFIYDNDKFIYGFDSEWEYESYDFLPVKSRRFEIKDTKMFVDYIEILNKDIEIADILYYRYNDCMHYIPHFNYDNVFQFIDDMYDIEICKIVYNGKRLYIKDTNNLFERKSTVVLPMNKYLRTSIAAPNSCTFSQLVKKVLKRIYKYTFRGFKLTLNFDPSEELLKAKSEEEKILTCKKHQTCQKYSKIYVSKNDNI